MPNGNHARKTGAKVNEHHPTTRLKFVSCTGMEGIILCGNGHWAIVARAGRKPGVTRLTF